MRGSIHGLESSAPIGGMLPAVFADDDLALRFVAGVDKVVGLILLALDCLHTYFDPALAPADFARWLGTWVGAEVDGTEPDARLRAAVAAAAYLHRGPRHPPRPVRSGAPRLRCRAGITESGAAAWDPRPPARSPATAAPGCTSRSGCPSRPRRRVPAGEPRGGRPSRPHALHGPGDRRRKGSPRNDHPDPRHRPRARPGLRRVRHPAEPGESFSRRLRRGARLGRGPGSGGGRGPDPSSGRRRRGGADGR